MVPVPPVRVLAFRSAIQRHGPLVLKARLELAHLKGYWVLNPACLPFHHLSKGSGFGQTGNCGGNQAGCAIHHSPHLPRQMGQDFSVILRVLLLHVLDVARDTRRLQTESTRMDLPSCPRRLELLMFRVTAWALHLQPPCQRESCRSCHTPGRCTAERARPSARHPGSRTGSRAFYPWASFGQAVGYVGGLESRS